MENISRHTQINQSKNFTCSSGYWLFFLHVRKISVELTNEFSIAFKCICKKSNDEQTQNFEAVGMWRYLVGETRLREPVQTLQLD